MHIKLYLKQFIDRLGYKVYKKGHVPIGVDFDSDIVRFSRDLQVKTIFDVGANIGQTALRFYKIFPHAKINDYLIEKEFRFCGFYDLHHSNNKGRFLLTYCNALFVNFSPVKPLS
ncbi:MAG: hypothetical protein RIE73_25275 [Coleofasciculus sp. C1-SOL-03]|uniref:hypothetical protein n=1 Tax=Coleofasciculus sp. C1-SOL-03 TaxID=3069522 RepID=UPI0032F2D409